MHTTWFPCGYYVVPCAHHVVSRWTPFGFQVDTMWFPGGQHRVSKVDTMWFLQDTTGFPHGCHVMSIWTPCVVEVTTWEAAQKTALHEANWLPCYICDHERRLYMNLFWTCYCNITRKQGTTHTFERHWMQYRQSFDSGRRYYYRSN